MNKKFTQWPAIILLLLCSFQSFSQQYFKVSSSTNCLPGAVKIYDVNKTFVKYQLQINDVTIPYSGADTTVYLKSPYFSMVLIDNQNIPHYDYASLNDMKNGTNLYFQNMSCPTAPVNFSRSEGNNSGTWEINNQFYYGNNFYVKFPSPGKYLISYTGTSSCGSVEHKEYINITDTITPRISLSIPPDSVCPGETITIYANNSMSEKFTWQLGDGRTLKTTDSYIYPNYSKAGKYKVSVIATNSCNRSATSEAEVTVSTHVVPEKPYIYLPDSVCINEDLDFNYSRNIEKAEWNFGDGESSENLSPEHSYSTTGKKYITLKITNKCGLSATGTDSVIVRNDIKPIKPLFYLPDSICPYEQFHIYANSTNNKTSWNMSDGNIISENSFDHFYTSQGKKIITLTFTNGCGISSLSTDSLIVNNNIAPNPSIGFYKSTICTGEIVRVSTSEEFKFAEWKFDNATTKIGYSVAHTYSTPGNYEIELKATNTCNISRSVKRTITITSSITEPDISVNGPGFNSDRAEFCMHERLEWHSNRSLEVNFIESSKNVVWDFGDGQTGKQNYHIYKTPGSYFPKVTITPDCGNPYTLKALNPVVIKSQFGYSEYQRNFAIDLSSDDDSYCPDSPVLLSSDNLPGNKFIWNFGDGTSKEGDATNIISHTYATEGNYTITLTAYNGCGADTTISKTITIENKTKDSEENEILIESNAICINDYISSICIFGKSYIWDYGDNSTPVTSGEKLLINNQLEVIAFKHKYTVPGNYTITVTETDYCGAKETKKYPVSVAGAGEKSGLAIMLPLQFYNMVTTPCTTVPFYVSSGNSFKWNFGDGSELLTTTDPIANHKYLKAGSFNPTVEVTNGCGITQKINYEDAYLITVLEECTTLGMDEKEAAINIGTAFPNPVTDILHVKIPDKKAEQNSVKVFNISGILVKEFTLTNDREFDLNVSNFEPGLYLLKIGDSTEVFTTKFNKL